MHEVESIEGKITSIPFDCVFIEGYLNEAGSAFGVWNDEKCYYILDDGDFFEPKKVGLPGDKVHYFNLSLIINFLIDHFESGS